MHVLGELAGDAYREVEYDDPSKYQVPSGIRLILEAMSF